jgi:hypothetical protein
MAEVVETGPAPSPRDIIDQALTAARSEPRIGPHFRPTVLEIDPAGVLTVEATVASLAKKRLALERMAATPGVIGIIDRMHVEPATPMSDSGIMDELRQRFSGYAAFQSLRIQERRLGELVLIRDAPAGRAGEIDLEVADGVVTLDGAAPSLTSKRLAGALAWRIPGVRDVVNGMAVEPFEEDAPILIEEAVKLVLEEDPFFDAEQIRVGVRRAVVRLTGLVKSEAARDAAEADAWCVFGVDDVINEIEVRA